MAHSAITQLAGGSGEKTLGTRGRHGEGERRRCGESTEDYDLLVGAAFQPRS